MLHNNRRSMQKILPLLFSLLMSPTLAQQYFAEKSIIVFFSDGVIEDIRAENKKSTSIFDLGKADVAFLVSIKDFQFPKTLMQVHFNEKYMESDKYPKSSFKGKLVGFNPAAKSVQQVHAVGKLTIHGVTKDVDIPGTIEFKDPGYQMKAKFMLKLDDYKITVPEILWQNIAKEVEVTIDFTYRPL